MDPEDEEIELQNGVEIEGQEQDIVMQNELIAVGKVNSVNGKTGDVVLTTSDLENDSDYQTGSEVESAISEAVAEKQDKLTAGDNITIENNVISASDTTYTAGNGLSLNNENEFSVDTTVVATQANLSTEVKNREDADTALQGQIDAISASSDVVDIVGTYAELQAYDTQHLKDNDIIKVLQDETQNNATTYYRWSTHTQTFTLIGQEGPYYTKASADAQFVPQTRTVNSKALSSNITLTASDVSAVATGDVVQTTGSNTTKIMSQKATTDALGLKLNISDYVVEDALADSTNPVQNKVLYGLLGNMPSDFFTGPVTVNGNGRDITLAGTMNAKLSDVKMYGDTTQQTYSGKNMYDETQLSLAGGFTRLSDGTIEKTLDTNGPWASYYDLSVDNPIGTYTISFDLRITNPSESSFQISNRGYIWNITSTALKDKDGNAVTAGYRTLNDSWKRFSFTITTTDSLQWRDNKALHIYRENKTGEPVLQIRNFQIEQGSTATAYEPYVGGIASPNPDYPQPVNVVTGEQTVTISDGTNSEDFTVNLGSTELCKIGTYQDYIYKSGDDWYVHKDIAKTIFTGSASESWQYVGGDHPRFTLDVNEIALGGGAGSTPVIMSNYFIGTDVSTMYGGLNNSIASHNSAHQIWIRDNSITSDTDFKTWLSTHNTTVYYALATPTDTQITNADLISDLNALWNALSYDGQTNFAITASGLSGILDVTAFKKTLAGLIGAINR